MFVSHRKDIEKTELHAPSLKHASKQVLVGAEQGWDDYVMRMFTLGKDGFTPRHDHGWQHIIYVVEGEGKLYLDGKDYPLTPGSVAYVPGESEHQLKNTGDNDFVFICIVPSHGDV